MPPLTVVMAALLIGGALAAPPFFCAPAPQQQAPYNFSTTLRLVDLHCSVRDPRGNAVLGLKKENFLVYENEVPQTLRGFRQEDVPVAIGLVVDHSGSMFGKIQEVQAAAETFVRSSNPEDQMFVVNFNECVSLGLPVGLPFTGEIGILKQAIRNSPESGRSAIYDAVVEALAHITSATYEKKVIIVVSDGGDNASRHSLARLVEMAEESDVIIYSIGIFDRFDRDRNPAALKLLARATGGEAFFPTELEDVQGICARIAKDIRTQYSLSYVPRDSRADGTYRTIRVSVSAPHRGRLTVRTRAGYIAPSDDRPSPSRRPEGTYSGNSSAAAHPAP